MRFITRLYKKKGSEHALYNNFKRKKRFSYARENYGNLKQKNPKNLSDINVNIQTIMNH